MKCLTYASLLLVILIVCSCAGTVNFNDPLAVSSAIKVEYSHRDEMTKYTGPVYELGYNSVFLSAWKYDQLEITNYSISVNAIYHGDLRNYDTAKDLNGHTFDFKPNFKKIDICNNSGCWQNENFELRTTREYLEAYKDSDLSIRATNSAGLYQTFTIPSTYIRAFLSVVK